MQEYMASYQRDPENTITTNHNLLGLRSHKAAVARGTYSKRKVSEVLIPFLCKESRHRRDMVADDHDSHSQYPRESRLERQRTNSRPENEHRNHTAANPQIYLLCMPVAIF